MVQMKKCCHMLLNNLEVRPKSMRREHHYDVAQYLFKRTLQFSYILFHLSIIVVSLIQPYFYNLSQQGFDQIFV